MGRKGRATYRRAWARTQSQERPRSSQVWRNRFTGYGRTGFGNVLVQYMGGTLTEKPRTEDDLCLIILLINRMFKWLNFL